MFTREDLIKESKKWTIFEIGEGKVIIPKIKGLYTTGIIPLYEDRDGIIRLAEYEERYNTDDAIIGNCLEGNRIIVVFHVLDLDGKEYERYEVKYIIDGLAYKNSKYRFNKKYIDWVKEYLNGLEKVTEGSTKDSVYNPFIYKHTIGNPCISSNFRNVDLRFKIDDKTYKQFTLILGLSEELKSYEDFLNIKEYSTIVNEKTVIEEDNMRDKLLKRLEKVNNIIERNPEYYNSVKPVRHFFRGGRYRLYNKPPKYISTTDVLKVLRFNSNWYEEILPVSKGYKIKEGNLIYRKSIRGLEIEVVTSIGFKCIFGRDGIVIPYKILEKYMRSYDIIHSHL